MRKINQIVVSTLVLFFCLLASAQTDKTLNIGIQQEWDILHPISLGTAASAAMIHMLQRNMVFQNENGIIEPEIAASIPSLKNKKAKIVTEGGKKKVQAIWEIRSEAKWSDGQTITCEDWHFAWTVGLNDNVQKSEKEIFSKIEKLEWKKETPKTCVVTYASDNWTFDRDLPPFLPKHIEGKIYEEFKGKSQAYEQNSFYVTKPNMAGLYSGPYTVEEIKIRSHIIMKANPNFWGAKPKIDKIIFKHVADANTFRAFIESKQINMISAVGFPPDMAIAMSEEQKGTNYRVHFIDSTLFQALYLNQENEFLSEKAVRDALALALDRDKVTQSFFAGKLNPAYTIISQKDPAFKNKKYAPDFKKANAILEGAGWKFPAGQSADSAVREKNGKKLIIDYKTSAGIRILETIQGFLCSEWKKIGIGCQIKNQPPREFLGDSVPKGNYAIGKFGNSTMFDSSLKGQYHSKSIPTAANAWTGGNAIRVKSKELDSLIEKYDSNWDRSQRSKLLAQIDDVIIKNNFIIPLYHRREAVVLPATFEGFTDSVTGTGFAFPEKWSF